MSRNLNQAVKRVESAFKAVGYDVSALNDSMRLVHLIGSLEFELATGGPVQWLTNTSGRYALATVDALRKIGAEQSADLLSQILADFPGGGPSPDDAVRSTEVRALRASHIESWREITRAILKWPDGMSVLLEKYVVQHLNDFV